ncbi:MAG: (2Fe-2S) ferredoxin domain-containing protein [bacterium]|nr:(2Fe-2S) ferredoxin domain-containing protein [bacterium]
MLKFPAPFPAAVFVCTNKRPDGAPKPCCADRGGVQLREELKQMARDQGLEGRVKIFASGCLGGCEQGVVALSYPKNELMLGVKQEDLQRILDEAVG